MPEAATFRPEQLVSARDLQRSMGSVLDRLAAHGSLLVLQHGTPVATLSALQSVNPQHPPGYRLPPGQTMADVKRRDEEIEAKPKETP